jgi:phosphohistidine phosphatase
MIRSNLMRELIIIRHGLAEKRSPKRGFDDRARHLTSAGRKKFRRTAASLRRWLPDVNLLLTSPLARAIETAAILTESAKWPNATSCAELEPGEDPTALLARVRKLRGSRIALVGHEPQLSRFVSLCIGVSDAASGVELKKGAAAVIVFAGPVRAGRGALTALLPPGVVRQLRS